MNTNPIPPLPDRYLQAADAAPHGKERAAVIREAWSWIHTPWLHENRVKGRGVDCGNYPAGVFANTGLIEPPPLYKYPHDFYMHSDAELFHEIVEQFCDRVDGEPLPGDIAGFKVGRPTVGHVAIVVCWPVVLHAVRPAKEVIADDHLGPLARAFSGLWRLKRWCE